MTLVKFETAASPNPKNEINTPRWWTKNKSATVEKIKDLYAENAKPCTTRPARSVLYEWLAEHMIVPSRPMRDAKRNLWRTRISLRALRYVQLNAIDYLLWSFPVFPRQSINKRPPSSGNKELISGQNSHISNTRLQIDGEDNNIRIATIEIFFVELQLRGSFRSWLGFGNCLHML